MWKLWHVSLMVGCAIPALLVAFGLGWVVKLAAPMWLTQLTLTKITYALWIPTIGFLLLPRIDLGTKMSVSYIVLAVGPQTLFLYPAANWVTWIMWVVLCSAPHVYAIHLFILAGKRELIKKSRKHGDC